MTDHGHDVSFGYFLIPNAADPLLSTAREVERLGLDYIGVQDHPYQRRFVDTWTLLSMIAATTETGPGVPGRGLPALAAARGAGQGRRQPRPAERRPRRAGARRRGVLGCGGGLRRSSARPWESLAALAEAIQVIRKVWSGERTSLRGRALPAGRGALRGRCRPTPSGSGWGSTARGRCGWPARWPTAGCRPSEGDLGGLHDMGERLDEGAVEAGRDPRRAAPGAQRRRRHHRRRLRGQLRGLAAQWVDG